MKKAPAIFQTIVVIGGIAVVAAGPSHAASIVSDYAKIQTLDTYAGDTTVFLESNPAGCEQGFWMRPNHPGFAEKLDEIEKAAHANARVKISGDGSDLWPQLEERNCRLESITVEPISRVIPLAGNTPSEDVDIRKQKEIPLEDEAPFKVKE
jgi:hypothetical protein